MSEDKLSLLSNYEQPKLRDVVLAMCKLLRNASFNQVREVLKLEGEELISAVFLRPVRIRSMGELMEALAARTPEEREAVAALVGANFSMPSSSGARPAAEQILRPAATGSDDVSGPRPD